jgi:hypothetical protein
MELTKRQANQSAISATNTSIRRAIGHYLRDLIKLFSSLRLRVSVVRFSLREQRIHKFLGIEGQQIAGFLAHSHIPYRQAELPRDRHHHAAFGSAV